MRIIAIAFLVPPTLVVAMSACAPGDGGCAGGCPSGTACDVAADACVPADDPLSPTTTTTTTTTTATSGSAAPHDAAWKGTAVGERPLAAMPRSCAEVKAANPDAPSGPTIVAGKDGSPLTVVCDQDTDHGGFTIVADVNWSTTDTSSCPSGWTWTLAGCAHDAGKDVVGDATFDIPVPYSGEVRGRVIGTINDSNQAFAADVPVQGIYVDGLSITAGGGHEHVFTYAAASRFPGVFVAHDDCPDDVVYGTGAPTFVGDGFSCDANNVDTWGAERVFLSATFPDAPFFEARLMARGDSGGAVFIQHFLLMVR